MIFNNKTIIFLLISLFFSFNGQASLLLEPYGGLKNNLTSDSTYSNSQTDFQVKTKTSPGLEYGLRLGAAMPMLWTALDFGRSKFKNEDTYSLNGVDVSKAKTDIDETKLGLAVGTNLLLFNVWAKYLFHAKWKYQNTFLRGFNPNSSFNEEATGKGYALGVAYNAIPLINVFLEYSHVKINKIKKTIANGQDITHQITQSMSRDNNSILLGVSAPFRFF
jgi:hypothetical protein